jgi:hypothetical protein
MSLTPLCAVYGPEAVIDQAGNLLPPGQLCTIFKSDGTTPATLYSDQTGNTPTANPTTSDANGNLTFFVAAPGIYIISTTTALFTTVLTVYVQSYPQGQFGFSGAALHGTVPSGLELPNFFVQEWVTTITIGTDGLDAANAFPVAFPNAVCTFDIAPAAVVNGAAGLMYLVNPYDIASWTLSNFKVSAIGFVGFRNATLALQQLAGASTIACSVRALGC